MSDCVIATHTCHRPHGSSQVQMKSAQDRKKVCKVLSLTVYCPNLTAVSHRML